MFIAYSLCLLLTLCEHPAIENEASVLVEKLGFMPLAISHAGCFLHEAKVQVGEYLSYYDEAFMTVQSKKPKFGWNYHGDAAGDTAGDTAATTWEISFARIEEQDKDAALLLLTCSYLNPEEIYEELWEDEKSSKVSKLESKFIQIL